MAVARHPIIANEGQFVVLTGLLVAFGVQWAYGPYAIPIWLLPILLIWIYRDPDRNIPGQPLTIVSPVDGRVMSVQLNQDPFLKREALHIVIRMSAWGVFSLRSVTEGKVMQIWQGKDKHGRCLAIWIQTDEKDDTVLVLHPGRWLKRLSWHLAYGDRIGQGQRIGHILFGNFIDIYLPASARSTIKTGQKFKAGSDGIAELMQS